MSNQRCLGVVWVFVLLIACAPSDPSLSGPGEDLPRRLPDPPAGWSFAQEPTAYDPETLYEYLDGGAPLYLKYGFERLDQARYQLGDDPLASVTVDVFDMGSNLGAFGLFRSMLPPDSHGERWCTEGYRSGLVAAAWKGKAFFHVEADDSREELQSFSERLIAELCADTDGDSSLPSILDALPREGLVPRSERYAAADLFGHAFLPGGVLARYRVDAGEVEVFFSDLGSADGAQDALGRLRSHLEQWGEIGAEISDLGVGGFRFTDPGLGEGLVIQSGSYIVGVHGAGGGEGLVREVVGALPRS